MEWYYYVNGLVALFSGYVAIWCFTRKNRIGGWLNLFASALNAATFLNHLI